MILGAKSVDPIWKLKATLLSVISVKNVLEIVYYASNMDKQKRLSAYNVGILITMIKYKMYTVDNLIII